MIFVFNHLYEMYRLKYAKVKPLGLHLLCNLYNFVQINISDMFLR